MINKEYQQCLEMILHHEGGYVNHPDDPGGETNLGVTRKFMMHIARRMA